MIYVNENQKERFKNDLRQDIKKIIDKNLVRSYKETIVKYHIENEKHKEVTKLLLEYIPTELYMDTISLISVFLSNLYFVLCKKKVKYYGII